MAENNIWGEIAKLIESNARGAVDRTQPMNVLFGTVVSAKPLEIQINQKMILTDVYLILTNAVRDYSVDITVGWTTEAESEHTHGNGNLGSPTTGVMTPAEGHNHKIKGRKKITIHNGLTIGEKVILLRAQGGQSYVVIDRVDEIPTTGESV